MRTPEALPEEKKIEYRLLKEEIAKSVAFYVVCFKDVCCLQHLIWIEFIGIGK